MVKPLLASAALLLTSGAFAQRSVGEVRALYSRVNDISARRDVKAGEAFVQKYATPDFAYREGELTASKAQYIANMKRGMSQKNGTTLIIQVGAANTVGKELKMNVVWTWRSKGKDGKPSVFVQRTTDTWIRSPQGYRIKSIVTKA